MRVETEARNVQNVLHPETGQRVPGVCLECSRCEREVTVAGQSAASYRRGYATLRQVCPRGERNFYACEDEPEELF